MIPFIGPRIIGEKILCTNGNTLGLFDPVFKIPGTVLSLSFSPYCYGSFFDFIQIPFSCVFPEIAHPAASKGEMSAEKLVRRETYSTTAWFISP